MTYFSKYLWTRLSHQIQFFSSVYDDSLFTFTFFNRFISNYLCKIDIANIWLIINLHGSVR